MSSHRRIIECFTHFFTVLFDWGLSQCSSEVVPLMSASPHINSNAAVKDVHLERDKEF